MARRTSRAPSSPAIGTASRSSCRGNGGQAAAINTAVNASRGEILCFLDADDWWAPGKLAAVGSAFDSAPGVGFVYHRLQPMTGVGAKVLRPIPRTLCRGDLTHRMRRTAGWWPFPMTSAISVRREIWEAAGEIPRHFRISADAWLAGIHPLLGHVSALSEALGFYRIHDNTWYRATDDATMLRRRMAHWLTTVEATNAFLATQGSDLRLSLGDHFPYRLAAARLSGTDRQGRVALALHGLSFAGEPNFARRIRDTLRDVASLSRNSALAPSAEPAE